MKPQAEKAGAIVGTLSARGVNVVVAGTWSIPAYLDDRPSHYTDEYREWQMKYPPDGPLHLELACRFSDQPIVESVLQELGFTLFPERPGTYSADTLLFNDQQGDMVDIDFFRPARDGGRIYPKLVHDQDWYYPPTTVSSGRLGSVAVQTEAPTDIDKARFATPQDEA